MEEFAQLTSPTLLLRPEIAKRNIQRMANKAKQAGLEFRPHFKTHQSHTVGGWFRDAGVTKITVSSIAMAEYFALDGWQDITIALPLNIREMDRINALARKIKLNVIVDNAQILTILEYQKMVQAPLHVWVEADCGDGRSGIPLKNKGAFIHVAQTLMKSPTMQFAGILTHAGHAYRRMSSTEAKALFTDISDNLGKLVEYFYRFEDFKGMKIPVSFGDTPLCSQLEAFPNIDELRPGNFVFYDFMQYAFGACTIDDIAMVMACPVISHQGGQQYIVHGGAVHFGKDFLLTNLKHKPVEEGKNFGWQVDFTESGWKPYRNSYLRGLSQEHGEAFNGSTPLLDKDLGQLAYFLPIHSCLTADLMMRYYLVENGELGEEIRMMKADPGYLDGFGNS